MSSIPDSSASLPSVTSDSVSPEAMSLIPDSSASLPSVMSDSEDPYNSNRKCYADCVVFGGYSYHVIGLLGKGSSGRVFYALQDGFLGFALKAMPKGMLSSMPDMEVKRMAERHCLSLAAELDLSFWLQMRDHFEDQYNHYFCVDLCLGSIERRLFVAVREQRPISQVEIRLMCAEMLLAIRHLRDQEIVHGDIKPGNFLITYTGQVVLCNFGNAKYPSKDEKGRKDYKFTSWACPIESMTPGYLAPQMMSDKPVCSHQTDIYCLGLVFLELMFPDHFFGNEKEWNKLNPWDRHKWLRDNSPLTKSDHEVLPLDSPGMKLCLEMMSETTPPEVEKLMTHPFFDGLDFDEVYAGAIQHDPATAKFLTFRLDEESRALSFWDRKSS